jgi:hypothetical protein
VAWEVEYTEDFGRWWKELSPDEHVALDAMIRVIERRGVAIGPPYSVEIPHTRYAALRQLRVPTEDKLLCVLYFVDETRSAVVLLAGVTGDDRLCPPEQSDDADTIYQSYLELRRRH